MDHPVFQGVMEIGKVDPAFCLCMRVLSFGESLVNFSAKETNRNPQLATNTKRNTRKKREIQERKEKYKKEKEKYKKEKEKYKKEKREIRELPSETGVNVMALSTALVSS
jgi:membrane protein insertase Oxa1/YidC/SpoIIIJ